MHSAMAGMYRVAEKYGRHEKCYLKNFYRLVIATKIIIIIIIIKLCNYFRILIDTKII